MVLVVLLTVFPVPLSPQAANAEAIAPSQPIIEHPSSSTLSQQLLNTFGVLQWNLKAVVIPESAKNSTQATRFTQKWFDLMSAAIQRFRQLLWMFTRQLHGLVTQGKAIVLESMLLPNLQDDEGGGNEAIAQLL